MTKPKEPSGCPRCGEPPRECDDGFYCPDAWHSVRVFTPRWVSRRTKLAAWEALVSEIIRRAKEKS